MDKNGNSPLHIAAYQLLPNAIEALLALSFDPQTPNKMGMTALTWRLIVLPRTIQYNINTILMESLADIIVQFSTSLHSKFQIRVYWRDRVNSPEGTWFAIRHDTSIKLTINPILYKRGANPS